MSPKWIYISAFTIWTKCCKYCTYLLYYCHHAQKMSLKSMQYYYSELLIFENYDKSHTQLQVQFTRVREEEGSYLWDEELQAQHQGLSRGQLQPLHDYGMAGSQLEHFQW